MAGSDTWSLENRPFLRAATGLAFVHLDEGDRRAGIELLRIPLKGKDESGVRYVKRNAIAGHRFESWEGATRPQTST